MHSSGKHGLAFVALGASLIIWGSAYGFTKAGVDQFPPAGFALLRFVFASLCFLLLRLLLTAKNEKTTGQKMSWKPAIYGGLCYFLLVNYSLLYCSATVGALIQGLMPATIAILARIKLAEKMTRMQWSGIIVSFCGVCLLTFSGQYNQSTSFIIGMVLMLLAVLSFSWYTVTSKKSAGVSTVHFLAVFTWMTTLLLLPAVAIETQLVSYPRLTTKTLVYAAYLGCVSSTMAYLLYHYALEKLPAYLVGSMLNLDPVVGAVFAWLWLGETITTAEIVCIILIVAGIMLTLKMPRAVQQRQAALPDN